MPKPTIDPEDRQETKSELLGQIAELQRRIDVLEARDSVSGPERRVTDSGLGSAPETLPVRICYLDPELHYRYCSSAYVAWVGRSPDRIIGHHVRDVLSPHILSTLEENLARVLAGETVAYEERITYAAYGLRYVQGILMPDFDGAGKVQGLFVSVADISDLAAAETALGSAQKILDRQLRTEAEELRGLDGAIRGDVLPRLSAIHGLRQHRDIIGGVLGNIADAVVTIDENGNIESLNPSAERMFGYDAVETVGRNVKMLMPEPYHGEHDDYLRSYLRTGDSKILNVGPREVSARRKDGSLFPIELSVGETKINERTVFIGAMRDITERKLADQAIRESEQRYRELALLSPDGIMVHTDGKIVFANPSLARILGLETPEQLIGTEAIAFAAPEEHEKIRQHRKHADLNDRGLSEEARFFRADGSETYLERMLSVVKWDGRKSYLVMFREVNERRSAERRLRENEARMRLITENIPVCVAYIDDDERIRFANGSYADWMGVPLTKIIGMRLRDLREPGWYEKFKPFLTRNIAGETTSYDGSRQLEDGKTVYFNAINVPHFDETGKILGFFIFVLDLTEHHEREEQLRQAQKMEAVGQLTGGIAHEFNNLLMVIVGNLELTMQKASGQNASGQNASGDDLLKFSNAAMSAAMRGAELTGQLLAFSRKQDLRIEQVDLNQLTENTLDMLQRMLGETIQVETSLADGLWPATADSAQIESVLMNLSLNARDAMPQGGRITVTTSNAPLTGDMVSTRPDVSPRDYVVLELADTGCGMTPKILARVFDPFFTTKDVGKGTGLGLSMVHGFVEQSGGFVDIESEPGHGTVVRIHLPRAETDTPATAPDPGIAKINDGTRATVLVVEDDRGVRELVVQMLRELGFATVEAQDGAATLKILEQRPDIDLVFIDVVLPGKWSGVDVAARIAEHRPDIRFIFTSGYPDGEIANSTPGQFPADFLRKPYLKSDLARTLNEVLENHPAK